MPSWRSCTCICPRYPLFWPVLHGVCRCSTRRRWTEISTMLEISTSDIQIKWPYELLNWGFYITCTILLHFFRANAYATNVEPHHHIHGRIGKNVSCDLHMEHLNRECKGSISGLGANITDGAIQWVGCSLHSSTSILRNFDKVNCVPVESGYHTVRSSAADINKLLKQIHDDSKVFSLCHGRKHQNFSTFCNNPLPTLSIPKLMAWFRERLQILTTYH